MASQIASYDCLGSFSGWNSWEVSKGEGGLSSKVVAASRQHALFWGRVRAPEQMFCHYYKLFGKLVAQKIKVNFRWNPYFTLLRRAQCSKCIKGL